MAFHIFAKDMAILRCTMRMRLVFIALLILIAQDVLAVRVKDLVEIEGVRKNKLVGYGLVVGLNGTGDKSDITVQAVVNMLSRMGLRVNRDDIKPKNVASVVVTAELPPFARPGMKIDVLVSALADAKSLQGGTLVMTPLLGPDGKVYAIAQGPVSIGGFSAGAAGAGVQKNHPTVGRVPDGAIVERTVSWDINHRDQITLILRRPDFTVSENLADRVNQLLNGPYARALDSSTVELRVPPLFKGHVVELIKTIEQLDVPVDSPAVVVINERTGTVVIGSHVQIEPVAIAHGGLTIEISTQYKVSQPLPFSKGKTAVVPEPEIKAKEGKAHLIPVQGTTLGELVNALNALG
ncbi:MAG: flagellar basal body P-ring protein FlgI, partial [Nitrospirae bacterium]